MATVITIAYADDHKIVRQGIIEFINGFGGMRVDIEASNGRELIDSIEKTPSLPDVCILDISMPVMNGFEAAIEIRKRWPSIKLLALTMFHEDIYIIRMLLCGATGYLVKNCDPEEVKKAIIAVYNNGAYFSDAPTRNLFNAVRNGHVKLPNITAKESELLKHFCTELSYAEIAAKVGTTARSVEGHRDSLFKKFNTNSRVTLAILAIQFGFVPLEIDGYLDENFLRKNKT